MGDGRIDQNDEKFGSDMRHLWPAMANGQGLAKSNEIFSITNEHRRWSMGQWLGVDLFW
jgi:hypothetical protein